MLTIKIDTLQMTISGLEDTQVRDLLAKLADIEGKVDKIMLSQTELDTLLKKIDDTTNHTAANVKTIADVDQQISSEIDAFLAATPVGTVLTQAQADQLTAISTRAQATSDAGDAQVAVLQAIAAKGAPVVPTPPAPVALTPVV